MTDEELPPSDRIVASAYAAQNGSLLNPVILEQLYEINRMYLDMLALGTPAWVGNQHHLILPDPVTASLMELTSEQRTTVAQCPFSLFNAQFHNGAYWFSLASADMVRDAVHQYGDIEAKRSGSASFAEMALFYAWH